MNSGDYNDHELIMLISENNDDARNIIYQKYHYIIDIIFKKYYKVALMLSIEPSDLFQDALLGFTDAINSYNEEETASFATFATICVDRRIRSSLRNAKTIKKTALRDTVSLEYEYDDFLTLKDLIKDDSSKDPLETISDQEYLNELNDKILASLSDFEKQVYKLLIEDYNYQEIATILNKEPKQIDNTIQRIKNKIKTLLK